MHRSQLATELPKFKDRLFYSNEEALASGLDGTVYIGSPAVHYVCSINSRENKETGTVTKNIQYIWLRTFWDQAVVEYGYVVESHSDGTRGSVHGVYGSVHKAFDVAKNIQSDSVHINKVCLDSGEEVAHYGFNWNQDPDFERCLKELKEGRYNV